MRDYYVAHPDQYARLQDRARERMVADPAKLMTLRAKTRAKRDGYAFDMVPADLLPLPAACPILGLTLEYGAAGVNNPAAPSVDRIDNAKGYVTGNVMVVSFRANELKSNATPDEMARLAAFYATIPARLAA